MGPACEMRRLCNVLIPTLLVAQLAKNFRNVYKKISNHRFHNSSLLVCVPETCNSVHILWPYTFQIHFNIILPSTTRPVKCLRFVFGEIKLVPKAKVRHLLVFDQWLLQVGRLGSIQKAMAIAGWRSSAWHGQRLPTKNWEMTYVQDRRVGD